MKHLISILLLGILHLTINAQNIDRSVLFTNDSIIKQKAIELKKQQQNKFDSIQLTNKNNIQNQITNHKQSIHSKTDSSAREQYKKEGSLLLKNNLKY